MIRTECAICEDHNLVDILTLYKYPITPSSNNGDSLDEYNDCVFSNCSSCGTVQLKNLIDPIKLYENSHNSTENTPTWREHHSLFASFILDNTDTKEILEIGGNSGTLYRVFANKMTKYSILDICDTSRPSEVIFLQGNCEVFDFTGHMYVVLSHTFEHLYYPRKFLHNLSKSRVNSVYISIPNMDNLYKSKNISIIHNEHTFFIGDDEIKYLFSQYGYVCARSKVFKNHSLFYHFVYNESNMQLEVPRNLTRAENIKTYISDFELSIKKINITMPCFICPAGHYGQKIYYYLEKYHNHILGFIDNDISKQGLRVYGTPKTVYSPNILIEYKDNIISVILYAGPYTKELQSQLNLLHNNIYYIFI